MQKDLITDRVKKGEQWEDSMQIVRARPALLMLCALRETIRSMEAVQRETLADAAAEFMEPEAYRDLLSVLIGAGEVAATEGLILWEGND